MWVRLIKACKVGGRKRYMGKILNVTPDERRRLLEQNSIEDYTGGFPAKKMKTDFFKPK